MFIIICTATQPYDLQPIHLAAQDGREEVIKLLVDKYKVNVNAMGNVREIFRITVYNNQRNCNNNYYEFFVIIRMVLNQYILLALMVIYTY